MSSSTNWQCMSCGSENLSADPTCQTCALPRSVAATAFKASSRSTKVEHKSKPLTTGASTSSSDRRPTIALPAATISTTRSHAIIVDKHLLDRDAAVRRAAWRGCWTGLTAGAALLMAQNLGIREAEPVIIIASALMCLFLTINAFRNSPIRMRSDAISADSIGYWISGFGGHAVIAVIFATLFGPVYNLAEDRLQSETPQVDSFEQPLFVVSPYLGPLLEAKQAGSNLRPLPLIDDELAPPVRETEAGELLSVTGQVSQPDGIWYRVRLTNGQEVYIKETLTKARASNIAPAAQPTASLPQPSPPAASIPDTSPPSPLSTRRPAATAPQVSSDPLEPSVQNDEDGSGLLVCILPGGQVARVTLEECRSGGGVIYR